MALAGGGGVGGGKVVGGVHDDRLLHTFQHFRVGENALFWSLRSCMDSDGHPVPSS